MRPVSFQREELTAPFLAEAVPLLQQHWAEIAHYDDIPLAPDTAAYLQMAATGAIRLYTVRSTVDEAPGPLLGYCAFFVRANPHYRESLQAAQDVLYLHPAARGITGWRFLKFCDAQLTAEGVQVAYHHVKLAHNFGPILERMGYEPIDVIYGRRLDHAAVVDAVTAPATNRERA